MKSNKVVKPSTAAILSLLFSWFGLLVLGLVSEALILLGAQLALGLLAGLLIFTAPSLAAFVILLLFLVASVGTPLFAYYAAKRHNENLPEHQEFLSAREGSEAAYALVTRKLDAFGDDFKGIGYEYSEFGGGARDVNLSTKVCLGTSVFGERVAMEITNIGYGVTEDRAYLTYTITDGREGVRQPTAQVSGIYVGEGLPQFALTPTGVGSDFHSRFNLESTDMDAVTPLLTTELQEVLLSKAQGAGALWSERGWLLTDTFVNLPQTVIATAGWEFLTEVLNTSTLSPEKVPDNEFAGGIVMRLVIPSSTRLPY